MARRSRGSGRRTDYTWFNFGDIEIAQDLGVATGVQGASNFQFSDSGTLTRVRGKVAVTMLPTAAPVSQATILAGLCILTADQVAAGAAPEIETGTADEVRWVWQGALYVTASTGGGEERFGRIDRVEIDSKGMARVKSSEVLAFIFQAPAALVVDNAATYSISYWVHGLFGA